MLLLDRATGLGDRSLSADWSRFLVACGLGGADRGGSAGTREMVQQEGVGLNRLGWMGRKGEGSGRKGS